MSLALIFFVLAIGAPSPWDAYIAGNCDRCPECCVKICETAAELEYGETSPCDGILLPETWARELVELRDVTLPACKLDAERAAKVSTAGLTRCEQERQALAKALRDTDQTIEEIQALPPAASWYESPALWFSVGVLVGAVTVGAASR